MSGDADLRVYPATVDFHGVTNGPKYVAELSIQNAGPTARRIRVAPPQGQAFKVHVLPTGPVAPGLDIKATVEWCATDDSQEREYHDKLYVSSGECVVEVPLHAYPPAPRLDFPDLVQFGVVVVGTRATRTFTLRNLGYRPAEWTIDPDPAAPEITFEPSSGRLPAGFIGDPVPAAGPTGPGRLTDGAQPDPAASVTVTAVLQAKRTGPARALARLRTVGQADRVVDAAAEVVSHALHLRLPPAAGPSGDAIDFGTLFFGEKRVFKAVLVNDGPHPASFCLRYRVRDDATPSSRDGGRAGGNNGDAAGARNGDEDDAGVGGDEDNPDAAVQFHPREGAIDPYSRQVVTVTFRPKPPRRAGFQSRADAERPEDVAYTCDATIDCAETGQQIGIRCTGAAAKPRVIVSQNKFMFGECAVNDRQDVLVTLKNGSDALPVDFAISSIAHFKPRPAAGRLAPSQTQNVVVTFAPGQMGKFKGKLALTLNGGIASVPLFVQGTGSARTVPKTLIGGTDKLASDFKPDFKFVRADEAASNDDPAFQRRLPWERPDMTRDGRNGFVFEESSEFQYTHSPSELARRHAHRSRYTAALRESAAQRQEQALRAAAAKAGRQVWMDPEGADMGMEPHCGLEEPPLAVPARVDPLFLHRPTDGSAGRRRTVVHDPDKLIRRKFRADPSTPAEERDCAEPLTTAQLERVSAGPKLLDFGRVNVLSTTTKCFSVANDTEQTVRVAVDPGHKALAKSSPAAQVIPPGSVAGFDIVLHPRAPATLRHNLAYTINGQHAFKATVVAEAAPITLALSASEVSVRFSDENDGPSASERITVRNPGNAPAELRWEAPAGSAFRAEPAAATVEPGGQAAVEVVFTPTPGCALEDVLQLAVRGGAAEQVPVSAELRTSKLAFVSKRLDFGIVPVGMPTHRPLRIRNVGRDTTAFRLDAAAIPGLSLSPARGHIAPGATRDIDAVFAPSAPAYLDGAARAPLLLLSRGLKAVPLAVRGEARAPSARLLSGPAPYAMEDDPATAASAAIDFGDVTVGATATVPVYIRNTGTIPAVLTVDLSPYPEFSLLPAPLPTPPPPPAAPVPAVLAAATVTPVPSAASGVSTARTATTPGRAAAPATGRLSSARSGAPGGGGGSPGGGGSGAVLQVETALVPDLGDGGARGAGDESPAATSRSKSPLGFRGPSREGGAPDGDGGEGTGAGEGVFELYKFRATIAPGEALPMRLAFRPQRVRKHAFDLSFALAGSAGQGALRRAVTARAQRPRLQLSRTDVDFGVRVVARDPQKKVPYALDVLLTNADEVALSWEVDAAALDEGGVFSCEPAGGTLRPRASCTLRVKFTPTGPVAFSGALPLFVDGRRDKPYMTVGLAGVGAFPRLAFDVPRVVLPPVPLNVVSRATVYVINHGYDSLDVRFKLPPDEKRAPLRLRFPEGHTIGLGKPRLPVEILFVSKKPASFSALITARDDDGNRFPLPVSACADASVLTTAASALPLARPVPGRAVPPLRVVAPPDRPPMLVAAAGGECAVEAAVVAAATGAHPTGGAAGTSAASIGSAGAGSAAAKAARVARGKGGGSGPASGTGRGSGVAPAIDGIVAALPSVDAASLSDPRAVAPGASVRGEKTALAAMRRWLNAALAATPLGALPAALATGDGRGLADLIEAASGRRVPGRARRTGGAAPQREAALAQAREQHVETLTLLKSYGAAVHGVEPEALMAREDAVDVRAAREAEEDEAALSGAGALATRRRALARAHDAEAPRAWACVLFQMVRGPGGRAWREKASALMPVARADPVPPAAQIRVFVLARVTPKQFAAMPGIAGTPDADLSAVSPGPADAGAAASPGSVAAGGAAGSRPGGAAELSGSNVLAQGEAVLLRWLSVHLNREIERHNAAVRARLADDGDADGSGEGGGGGDGSGAGRLGSEAGGGDDASHAAAELPFRRLTSFAELADGAALGAAIRSHVPALAQRGRPLHALHLAPLDSVQAQANAEAVAAALRALPVPLDAGAAELGREAEREAVLLALFLYQTLPQLLPRTTVEFAGRLGQRVAKRIALKNPSKRAIVYDVRLDGSTDFRVPQQRVELAAGAEGAVDVEVEPRFSEPTRAALTLVPRREAGAGAATLVFTLASRVTGRDFAATHAVSTATYSAATVTLQVRNPFDADASFRIHVEQARTRTDGADVGQPGGKGKAGRRAAAARLQRLERDGRFPDAFWTSRSVLKLKRGATKPVDVQFLPCVMGAYRCEVVFLDDRLGELAHCVEGTATPPRPSDTLRFQATAGGAVSFGIHVPPGNPALARARLLAVDRLSGAARAAAKEDAKALAAAPAQRQPQPYAVSFASPFYSGPEVIRLGKEDGGGKAPDKPQLLTTAVDVSRPNRVSFTFMPKTAGIYPSTVTLSSPLDVRVYELEATVSADAVETELLFESPARQTVAQDIPIVNSTDTEWRLRAEFSGDSMLGKKPVFSGARDLRVPPSGTAPFKLSFCPPRAGDFTAALRLVNPNTSAQFLYKLVGRAEDPLAESHVVVECKARERTVRELVVTNDGARDETYRVETDLMGASGSSEHHVAAGKSSAYSLALEPLVGGTYTGAVTFRANDDSVVWHTVEVRADPPAPEEELRLAARARKAVAAEIAVDNPLDEEVELQVSLDGPGLLGPPTLVLGPLASGAYELVFSPLVPGAERGSVSFVHDRLGEFWYRLQLEASPADEEQLPRMRCTVGESVSQPVRLRNPLSVPVSLRAAVLNERNFAVAPRQLDLGPHESGEVLLEYTPSSVEEEEAGTVRFSHPEAGEFVYNVVGSGSAPGEMTPVMVTAPVGTSITHAFAFRNPFPRPIGVAASLDLVGGAGDATGRRELALLTRKARWTVEPFASVQLPLMFNPSRIAEQRATLVVAAGAEGLEWRYPVFAVAEASASGQTYEIRGRCREATEGVLAVRLPDVGALEAETAFDVEVVVPPEARSATDRCLRVEGQKTTLGPGEDTLRVAFLLAPMRPFECAAQMLVTRRTGGRWRFDVKLVAEAAAVDDVIVVEAAIKRTASVAFPLTNNVSAEAPFEAFFTPDSPIELSVFPAQGVLPPLGQPGTNVVVSFTPREYGKTLVGKLVIRTEEMQWTYEVRGRPPTYTAPQGEARVDARIGEGATERLRHHRARNHMQANMRVGQGTPSARRR